MFPTSRWLIHYKKYCWKIQYFKNLFNYVWDSNINQTSKQIYLPLLISASENYSLKLAYEPLCLNNIYSPPPPCVCRKREPEDIGNVGVRTHFSLASYE